MDRISTATRATDLFGAGKHGFKNGDLGLAIAPTDLNAAWFNGAQEELVRIIEAGGVVPDAVTLTQVQQALKRIFAGNLTPVANGTTNLTADNAGLVLIDAAAGNVTINLPAVTAVSGVGLQYMFYRKDSTGNIVTVNRAGTNSIDGATSFTITGQYSSRTIEGDASGAWSTIAQTNPGATEVSRLQGGCTATAAGGAITVTLQPGTIDFRSTTLNNGATVRVSNASAITLVIPNTANFGAATADGTQRLAVMGMSSGTAIELAVANLRGGVNLDETELITTVAIGSATTTASLGSTTARTSLAQRVLCYIDALFTTGTGWTISKVQPAGGNAASSLGSIGYGQTWQVLTGSRAGSTTYYNTTGRPIMVAIQIAASAAGTVVVNGTTVAVMPTSANSGDSLTFIVPVGASYSLTGTFNTWAELR
ncbi:hypothetical protein ACO2Q9_02930 [Variovorax sp. VNK109]|uniref:hypothetical protein n=1 Tax=Variovorax sp. VNK109 TaxID=3400919 RepID=UPI003C11EDA3